MTCGPCGSRLPCISETVAYCPAPHATAVCWHRSIIDQDPSCRFAWSSRYSPPPLPFNIRSHPMRFWCGRQVKARLSTLYKEHGHPTCIQLAGPADGASAAVLRRCNPCRPLARWCPPLGCKCWAPRGGRAASSRSSGSVGSGEVRSLRITAAIDEV